MKNITMTDEYTTANGYEVEIFAIDNIGDYPVQGRYLVPHAGWKSASWTSDGKYLRNGNEDMHDLIQKKKITVITSHANIVRHGNYTAIFVYADEATAKPHQSKFIIASKPWPFTSYEEGEGL